MAFDRDLQPVSVSYASSTPPTSPPRYLSPRAEGAFVDAGDVERWLTFPTIAGSTDDLAYRASNGKNAASRLMLGDVTARRRRQQLQAQNQSPPQPSPSPSPRVSSRHNKLIKEWQEKEQRQLTHQSQSSQRNPVPPSASSSRKREHFRRTAKMTIAAMEKNNRGNSHSEKSSVTNSANSDIPVQTSVNLAAKTKNPTSDKAKDGEKNSSRSEESEITHERLDTKFTKRGVTSPSIAAIRRRREQRLRERELEKTEKERQQHGQEMKAPEQTNSTQITGNDNEERIFSVSPSKKIHLLKRHDAAKGKSPLVREVSHDDSIALQNNAAEGTIDSNEKAVSTVAKLRMIRRQMADGNNRRTHEQEVKQPHEKRSLLATMDGSIISRHENQQSQHPQISTSATMDDSETTLSESELVVNRNSDENGETKTKADSDVDNANSTLRIKDALARSRSYRRSTIKKRDAIQSHQAKKREGESFGESVLRNHFQSSSIPCPSVLTVGSSTIDCRSNITQTENESDDETSAITNDSEQTDEGVSQLTLSTEPEATAKNIDSSSKLSSNRGSMEGEGPSSVDLQKISPILESGGSAISSNITNDDASLENDSTDSSFDEYVDELMEAVGSSTNEKEEEGLQMLEHASQIRLHVYDLVANDTKLDLWGYHFPLGQVFNAVNASLHSIGTGAYHVGLEINGIEYAYGANSTEGLTGIFTCKPKHSPGYQYRTTIDFGNRVVKKQFSKTRPEFNVVVDGQIIVRDMVKEYLGTDYDLLRKNCCTFAHDACIRLGINEDEIPSWFHNLAAVGAKTQDAATYTLAPISQLFGGKEDDEISDCPNETASKEKLEAVEVALVEEKNYVADTAYEY